MTYTAIVGTLAFVRRGNEVLMVHRNARPEDAHLGKFNGLGGKLEPGEDMVAGIRRELREEANIEATIIRLRGTMSWPGFGPSGENWVGCIFVVDDFTGTVPDRNEEGSLHWIPIDEILDLPLWEGDYTWLPLVFDDSVGQFHGVMPYRDGRPVDWSVTILP